jgi:Coatomer WD associated region
MALENKVPYLLPAIGLLFSTRIRRYVQSIIEEVSDFTILEQLIEVCDLTGAVVKSFKPPVQTNEIFYGGTASLILSSTSSVVLYDIQQQKTIAELNTPPVKYIVWSQDVSQVALLSKHSKCLDLSLPRTEL